MNKLKHTPGPWSAGAFVISCEGGNIATAHFLPDMSDEEAGANAQLMAASPELADALESALAEIRKIVDEGPFYNSDEWDEGPALAALRKAGRLP